MLQSALLDEGGGNGVYSRIVKFDNATGLAVGPLLVNGKYLLLAGTDNDYSVTQTGSGTQCDVWFDFSLADP